MPEGNELNRKTMFDKEIYRRRREQLKKSIGSGLLLFWAL